MYKKLVAEAVGTFTLVLAVQMVPHTANPVLATPIMAAIILGLFVYTIGGKSGCHINPAVTIGLWSIKKIDTKAALSYIGAQIAGAALSIVTAAFLIYDSALAFETVSGSLATFSAEAAGAAIFTFGIAAVVYGKVKDEASGIVIGLSLLIGIAFATSIWSSGLLNPAVALAYSELNFSYLLGPVVGAVLGMNLYKKFIA